MLSVDSALHRPLCSPATSEETSRPHIDARLRYEACALRMMQSLTSELLEEEEANLRRAARDAARYEGVELGSPFRAIVAHAGATIPRLMEIARGLGLRRKRASGFLRRLMGSAADLYRERFVTAERAYRTTIARMRHGLDLVRLLRSAAEGGGDDDIVRFCDEWLSLRNALCDALIEQIDWFADRPRVSMETAHCIANARKQLELSRRLATHCAGTPRSDGYGRLLAGSYFAQGVPASNLQ